MRNIILSILCLAALFAGERQTQGGSHPKYILIYTVLHGGYGNDPCMTVGACWTETRAEFFFTIPDAQERMNKKQTSLWANNGNFFTSEQPSDIQKENFVGLYAIAEIPVTQQKVGVEEKPVTEMKKVDKLEWRVKQ